MKFAHTTATTTRTTAASLTRTDQVSVNKLLRFVNYKYFLKFYKRTRFLKYNDEFLFCRLFHIIIDQLSWFPDATYDVEYPFEDRGLTSGANLQPEVNVEDEEDEEKVNHNEEKRFRSF